MLYTIRSLAEKLFSRKSPPAKARRRPSARPGLEMLEDRLVLAASPWSSQFFAPYVNTLQPQDDARFNDYATAAQLAGTKYLALGFITANDAGQPGWEGNGNELGSDFDRQMQNQVNKLRARGGDVMISFGGASGTELAQANQNVNQLQQAYQQVINEYGLTHVDFDIEGAAARDNSGSIDRRSQAIAGLEQAAAAAGKELQVYLTLPTSSAGLMANEGLNVLQSALNNGVKIAGVNIMTMDYADFVNYDGQNGNPTMGDAAISAASGLFTQLKTELAVRGQNLTDAQVWHMIGITPQIGVNVQFVDGEFRGTEVFTLANAQKVERFAHDMGVGRLSFWAIGVDQNPNNITNDPNPSETYSGVTQQPFAFSKIFAQFAPAVPDLTGATFSFTPGSVLTILSEDPTTGGFVGSYAGAGAFGIPIVTGSITNTTLDANGVPTSTITFVGIDVIPGVTPFVVSFTGTLRGSGKAAPSWQDTMSGDLAGLGVWHLEGQDF
jgi:hypothetical protein